MSKKTHEPGEDRIIPAIQERPLIILTGPTAVGKTALSLTLARKVQGEIISADSMQVYRYMDIGSAKIRMEEREGIPHHMLDILDPREEFHVVIFQERVKQCIREIYERGHIPILTGGTGFYIQAILYDIDFRENQDDTGIRQELEQLAEKQGSLYLHQQLRMVDPAAAEAIHPNNRKRIIRALEFYHLTGEKISEHNEAEKQKRPAYQSCYFVLTDQRERLYQRIDARVDDMIAEGLVEEVQRLKQMGCHKEMVSMQGLGYKEILRFLEGEISLEEAVYLIKRDTRHFAKRQLTWFRRERDVIWLSKEEYKGEEALLEEMLHQLEEKGIWKQSL